MNKLKRLNRGNFRIWWFCNKERIRLAALVLALIAICLWYSERDHQDRLDQEKQKREQAEKTLYQHRAFEDLPPVAFVFDARTPEQLEMRMAEVYGRLGVLRYEIFAARQPLAGAPIKKGRIAPP